MRPKPVPGDIVTVKLFVSGIVERDEEGLYINVGQQNIRYNDEPVNIEAHAMPENLPVFDQAALEKQLENVQNIKEAMRRHRIGFMDEDFE